MSKTPDYTSDEKFDGLYMNVAQSARGIEPLLDTLFSFLRRKTDFFSGPPGSDGDTTESAIAKVNDVLNKHRDIFLKEKEKNQAKEIKKKKIEMEKERKKEAKKANKKEVEDVIEIGDDGFDISTPTSKPVAKPISKPVSKPVSKPATKSTLDTAEKDEGDVIEDKDEDKEEDDDSPPPPGNGGTVPGKYVWTQTLSEINLLSPLPPNTRGRDMIVSIQKKSLKISLKNQEPIVNAKLSHTIIMDDSFWTIEDGNLSIILQKSNQMEWWDCVCVGDPKINTKKVEPENSKLNDLDGEMRQTVEKMMFDQRQKALGLPSSDEQKKHDLLDKFKKAHPEMDFSQAKIQ